MYTPNCDVFWVGAYPHKDPTSACRRILRNSSLMLHWPQLPKKAKKERMIDQTYAALAGKKGKNLPELTKGSAAGWSAMWRLLKKSPKARERNSHFKTQIAGPITLFGKLQAGGLRARKEDEALLLQYVNLWLEHAYWQIEQIQEQGFKPVVVLDEPLLPTYMGPSGSARARKTQKLLKSLIIHIKRRGAMVGIHCCNRVSPATLVALGVDLIHFDAYSFRSQVAQSRDALRDFLRGGGVVAWGVIPTNETLTASNQSRIEKFLTDDLAAMEGRGLPLRRVLAQSMVAPTCGTGTLTAVESEKILDFATTLSRHLKARYRL